MTYVSSISHSQLQTFVILHLHSKMSKLHIFTKVSSCWKQIIFYAVLSQKKNLFSISSLLSLIPHPLYPFMMHRKQPHFNRGT